MKLIKDLDLSGDIYLIQLNKEELEKLCGYLSSVKSLEALKLTTELRKMITG